MARAIATVGGVAIVPGISLNRRWYTREALAGAVARAQERLAAGEAIPLRDSFGQAAHPLTTRSHHGAEDDTTRVAGRLTSVSLGENGEVRFTADIADTAAGRDIAALVDTSDGKPAFLRGVSIRGSWEGRVRKVTGPDNLPCEQGAGLSLDGLDYTASPGVPAAGVDTFAWAADGQQETTERVLITESVQEASVTVSEQTTPASAAPPAMPEGLMEAVRAALMPPEVHVLGNGLCVTCGIGEAAKEPYGDVPYADPGYLDADGNQASKSGKPGVKRYPIDPKHARAAWSYISKAKNAAKYTAAQLKRIKGRIKAAMGKIGAKVSSETASGFVITEAYELTPAVLEWMGDDPSRAGSWCISASNGPVSLSLSSWAMDPADLKVILTAAADAAADTLAALDPDMDGDVDVPGVGGNSDTDGDGGHETAPEDSAPATEAGNGPVTPAGHETGTEDPAMGEATTPAAGNEPATTPPAAPATETAPAAPAAPDVAALTAAFAAAAPVIGAAVTEGIAKAFEARDAATAAAPATAATPPGAPPAPAAPAAAAPATEAAPPPPAPAADATAAPAAAPAATETEEARIERRAMEQAKIMATEAIQEAVADGTITVHRHGIAGPAVAEHRAAATEPEPTLGDKAPHTMSEDEFADKAGAALDHHTFGGRVDSRGRPLAVTQLPGA